ncbi:MAG: heme exporter protein CcmB [Dehalococcoidia bacterium]
MRGFWGKVFAIVWKDILSELRARDIITSVFIFALLVIVIFNFAFEPGAENIGIVAAGVLWVAFTFAGVLGLNRSFVLEKDKGCLEGLMLCPVDREVIYVGKMLSCFIFMLIIELIILPIFSILLNLPLFPPGLVLITVLATIGFVAVGTLFSAIAVNTRAREIMLPLLFLPIVVPVIIAAVKGSALVLEAAPWSSLWSWLEIIVAFDVIFLVMSAFAFEFVIES